MASTISAGTTSATALNMAGDTTGNLAFQTSAGTYTQTMPNVTGNIVTTGDSGTVTKSMISTSTSTGMGICRAWVNFNGVTATVNSSYNVSSVTLVSTGVYTVNFTTAMPNTNYCSVGTTMNVNSMSFSINGGYNSTPTVYSTTQAQFVTSQSVTLYTCSLVCVAFFST